MPHLAFPVLTVCFVVLLSGGCGSSRSDPGAPNDYMATPTHEPVPTFTPTTVSVSAPTIAPATSSTATPPTNNPTSEGVQPDSDESPADSSTAPTASPSDGEALLPPTATPTPSEDLTPEAATLSSPQLNVIGDAVNVRGGPGTNYEPIDVVAQGVRFPVTGRNEQGDWWQVCCFDDQSGWLYGPLVEVQNAESEALAAEIPPTPVIAPTSVPVVQQEPQTEPLPQEQAPAPDAPATVQDTAQDAMAHNGTSGSFDPNAQYQIVHYRVLGFADNNGGIFNKGGQQFIFVTVLDQNGNGVDGAVVKDAVGDKLNVAVGNKGPGKSEIKMDWDPYKLYVAADPSGAVTSQISNQMNNPYPHIPDVVGMLGPPDHEFAICPTIDDRCEPPFYHAHWSYAITFQKVK